MSGLLFLVTRLLDILIWVIIIDAVLTWIPQVNRRHPIVVALRGITQPLYAPFRKLVPPEKTGFLDISPLLAIITLNVIIFVLSGIARTAR